MLLKLIKYDFKSNVLKFAATFAVFALLCIIVPLALYAVNTGAALRYGILTVPLANVAIAVLTFVFVFQRYASSLYGNEGYLLQTLPTTGKNLVASKLITAFVYTVVAAILGAVSILILLLIVSANPVIGAEMSAALSGVHIAGSAVAIAVTQLIVETVSCIMMIFFAISVSKLTVWGRFGALMGFVAFFGVVIVRSLVDWAVNHAAAVEISVRSSNNAPVSSDVINQALSQYTWASQGISIVVSAVFAAALFVGTSLIIDRKTSLR